VLVCKTRGWHRLCWGGKRWFASASALDILRAGGKGLDRTLLCEGVMWACGGERGGDVVSASLGSVLEKEHVVVL
jgi:hypothetical protein